MPSIDIFKDDAFSLQTLTQAINNPPAGQVVPTMLDALFAGGEEGITTTAVSIERDNDSLVLVPAAERGAPGLAVSTNRRDMVNLNTFHLPQVDAVMADEIQGVRAFGSETELQTLQAVVNRKVFKMRKQIAATLAFHRIGALKGTIYDANGTSVLLDLFDRFGFTKQTVDFKFSESITDIAQKIRDAKRKAEDVIGDTGIIVGWIGLAGRNWFDGLVGHDSVTQAYQLWTAAGSPMRNDVRGGFDYQEVTWREFYGKVGSVTFIDPDKALLIPIVAENFQTRFAPANYMETVNTIGLPFYAKQWDIEGGKGVKLEAQSNPLAYCPKPHANIELTKS